MGVKGDAIGGEKYEAGYHGDVMSQEAVTAATRTEIFAKAQRGTRSKIKMYEHA